MRILFMGSPEFAVPALRQLVASGQEIVAVVTQPDKPAGRGKALKPSAVKKAALKLGLPVLQPASLRPLDIIQKLRSLRPDVIVVAAFGKILPREVLDIPPRQCINVHPSLLPRLRGPSPIPYAILEGDPETGVTLMLMVEQMDAGPILTQRREPILPDDTAASLGQRLAQIGAEMLVELLPEWERGAIAPRPQDESEATYSHIIKKEEGRVNWQQSADEIGRRCRAFYPWPGCFTFWNSRLLKLINVLPFPDWVGPEAPGQIVVLAELPPLGEGIKSNVAVATGHGALLLLEVQIEGRGRMKINEFLRGHKEFASAILA